MTRRRFAIAGPLVLRGRAWSGRAPVVRVELPTDGGHTWTDTTLRNSLGRNAWLSWSARWDATPATTNCAPSRSNAMEHAGHGQQHGATRPGHGSLSATSQQSETPDLIN